MRFFFDRSAPIGIAKVVRAIDEKRLTIVHHDEDNRFCPTTPDIDWMKILANDGSPGWVIISGGGRILKNQVEKQVLDEIGLMFFCLDSQWVMSRIHDSAWKFLRLWPDLVRIAEEQKYKRFRIRCGSSTKIEQI